MALTACGGAGGSSPQANSAVATVAAQEGRQYRAVCIETAAHGGNQQVLSRWLDSRDKALALGEYHSNFKDKGHRVNYEERVRPPHSTP